MFVDFKEEVCYFYFVGCFMDKLCFVKFFKMIEEKLFVNVNGDIVFLNLL